MKVIETEDSSLKDRHVKEGGEANERDSPHITKELQQGFSNLGSTEQLQGLGRNIS